jgi:hypothetical protein
MEARAKITEEKFGALSAEHLALVSKVNRKSGPRDLFTIAGVSLGQSTERDLMALGEVYLGSSYNIDGITFNCDEKTRIVLSAELAHYGGAEKVTN